MPNYIGSSLEFTKNNLIQIVGVNKNNIEVIEVSTAPEGTIEGTVINQTPKPYEDLDLSKTLVNISVYKPKPTTTTTQVPHENRIEVTPPQTREAETSQTTPEHN